MNQPPAALDQRKLAQASEIIHALAHPLRLQIVDFLANRDDTTVVDIQDQLGHEAAMVSNHLRLLRQAGILDTSRQGKYINYSIDGDRLDDITAAVMRFGQAVEEVIA